MPASDKLSRPQAKTTFLAWLSFLILMVLSMRETPGLWSLFIVWKESKRHKSQRRDTESIALPLPLPIQAIGFLPSDPSLFPPMIQPSPQYELSLTTDSIPFYFPAFMPHAIASLQTEWARGPILLQG